MLHVSRFKFHDRNAFSLIEIAVVVGIVGIIATIALVTLFSRRNVRELNTARQEIVAMLREAQSRSVAQEDNATWGVRFDNTTSTAAFYAMFKDPYGTSTVVEHKRLPPRVRYATSSVAQGSFLEITFAQISGLPSTSTTITLELTVGSTGQTSENISQGSSGQVDYDDFDRENL